MVPQYLKKKTVLFFKKVIYCGSIKNFNIKNGVNIKIEINLE